MFSFLAQISSILFFVIAISEPNNYTQWYIGLALTSILPLLYVARSIRRRQNRGF